MAATRVAVLDDYQQTAHELADWDGLAAEVIFFGDHLGSEDELAARLAPFQVVCAMRERTPFTASLFDRLPALTLLVTTGMGNAAIDLTAAGEHGVTVCGTGGSFEDTAELAWGLILAVARSIPAEDAALRAGSPRWQHTVGANLAGRTLGVLGLGRLGSRVAAVGRAFDMEVIAWSANLTSGDAAEVGAVRVEKDELFARSDVLSVHLRLSDRTRGLVGASELALMKPTAILVNTSRGPIVDSSALLAALHEGRLGGAGLDVFDTEPLAPDDPLRQAPRTVLTPHLGYVSHGTYRRFYRDTVADIAAFLDGSPVRVLNKPR